MIVNTIFSSFLIIDNLPFIDNKNLEEYAVKLKEQGNGVTKSNFLGWQSDILQAPNDQVTTLVGAITERLTIFKSQIGYDKDAKVFMNNIWININQKCSFNRPHIHPGATFSGVYYVKCNKNSGDLVLKHPSMAQQYSLKEEAISEFTDFSASSWAVFPEEGKLVMFPSWLEHYVEPNTSNEERISIAFNADIVKD